MNKFFKKSAIGIFLAGFAVIFAVSCDRKSGSS